MTSMFPRTCSVRMAYLCLTGTPLNIGSAVSWVRRRRPKPGRHASEHGLNTSDWLLGLTDRPGTMAELLAASLTLTEAPRALFDEAPFLEHENVVG